MTPETFDQDIRDGASLGQIAAFLDELDDSTRQRAVNSLGKTAQARLYDIAADAEPLTLGDFVPPQETALTPVAHRGLNTLPLPTAGKRFTKWMARGGDGTVIGYNNSPFGPLIGPGYFVLRESPDESAERGAIVVDYYAVPDGPVPGDWPWVRANWVGLQFFVYHQTRDYMRRVSQHVTIGSAFKWDKVELGSYFVLCRETAEA